MNDGIKLKFDGPEVAIDDGNKPVHYCFSIPCEHADVDTIEVKFLNQKVDQQICTYKNRRIPVLDYYHKGMCPARKWFIAHTPQSELREYERINAEREGQEVDQ